MNKKITRHSDTKWKIDSKVVSRIEAVFEANINPNYCVTTIHGVEYPKGKPNFAIKDNSR